MDRQDVETLSPFLTSVLPRAFIIQESESSTPVELVSLQRRCEISLGSGLCPNVFKFSEHVFTFFIAAISSTKSMLTLTWLAVLQLGGLDKTKKTWAGKWIMPHRAYTVASLAVIRSPQLLQQLGYLRGWCLTHGPFCWNPDGWLCSRWCGICSDASQALRWALYV